MIAGRDIDTAAELEAEDDSMDALHRQLFTVLLDEHWTHGIEAAIDMTLFGRYYERYADHAVSVARRVVYLVTGEMPNPPAAPASTRLTTIRLSNDLALLPALVGDGGDRSGGLRGRGRGTAWLATWSAVVEVVAQRDAGRDVERDDRLVGHAVEVLDQRAQRVAVRGDQTSPGRPAGRARSRRTSTAASATTTSFRHSVRGTTSGGRSA